MYKINKYLEASSRENIVQRIDYILHACSDRCVLHFGCADYPVTEEKLRRGILLHEKIEKVTKCLYGIDSSPEGIKILRNHGYRNVYVGNVEDFEHHIFGDRKFDVIIAGEIIEHLSNSGIFLEAMKPLLKNQHSRLIITTVNAYCLFRFAHYVRHHGQEWGNKDHVSYYSALTLRKLVEDHGYQVQDIRFYPIGNEYRNVKGIPCYFWFLDELTHWPFPFLGDGLIFSLSVR